MFFYSWWIKDDVEFSFFAIMTTTPSLLPTTEDDTGEVNLICFWKDPSRNSCLDRPEVRAGNETGTLISVPFGR